MVWQVSRSGESKRAAELVRVHRSHNWRTDSSLQRNLPGWRLDCTRTSTQSCATARQSEKIFKFRGANIPNATVFTSKKCAFLYIAARRSTPTHALSTPNARTSPQASYETRCSMLNSAPFPLALRPKFNQGTLKIDAREMT